jgi:hypothetical protein
MILNNAANAVLQEFGGLIEERLLSFEDAKREFLYTRGLELQKLGIADSNKTVIIDEFSVSDRDGEITMPTGLSGILPAFVEYGGSSSTSRRDTVRIVTVDDIPSYEGSRAIAFYGDPLKYRLSWNSWDHGTLFLGYDGIEDMDALLGSSDLSFPPNFWTFLVKKTAFNIIDVLRLKIAFLMRVEEIEQMKLIENALNSKERKLLVQCQEWSTEFKRWINKDLNQQPVLRRSNEELMARQGGDCGSAPSFLFDG